MARIDLEGVARVASLARLRLSPAEAEAMTADLDAILGHVEQLAKLDTSSVEPTAHVIPLATPLREDRVVTSLDPEVAVANAPVRQGTAFAVPAVLEGEEEG